LASKTLWERVLSPPPWRIGVQRARLSMHGRIARDTASSVLLAFAILTLLTVPTQTQGESVALMRVCQSTTASSATTSNTTSTSLTSTTSSSVQWDLLIPLLVIAIGASLTVMVAAIVAMKRRHARVMPTVQLICPRCRTPVSPYDAACRNCHTPLYHPYRYYQQRR
jgi:hypothetical protein